MKLITFDVSGFRSIAALGPLKLGSPTLLTGHNDAGKTALLDAVSFLLNGARLNNNDRTYSNISGLVPEGEEPPRVDESWVEGTFELSPEETAELALSSPLRIRRISRDGVEPVYEYFANLPAEELLRGYQSDTNPQLIARINSLHLSVTAKQTKPALMAVLDAAAATASRVDVWQSASIATVKALPLPARFNPSGSADAEEAIREALQTAYRAFSNDNAFKGNLRKLEAKVEEHLAEKATALRDHIRAACPDIGDVAIMPIVSLTSGLKQTRVSVTSKAGENVALDSAGAGRARRVSLAVWEFTTGLLGGSGDVVILYDEPDTHLDYAHQRDFMNLVRKQCTYPNVQMLIATHSMNLIDGVDIADVVHVRHVAHRTVVERLADGGSVGEHLGAIAAALGLRNTVLLNERLFVGVEGATETAALPVLFRLAKGKQLESAGIALWSCRNNEGAVLFAEFLVDHNREVVFLVDSDSKTNSRHVFSDNKLRGRKLTPEHHGLYIGDPKEFEDIFSDETWASVANSEYPRVDGRPWVEGDIQSLRSKPKFSDALVDSFRTESDSGPKGKPDMMTTLALHLDSADQIPEQLRLIFDELETRATATLVNRD